MGQGAIQIFKDFANWSTVCGVPHIANSSTKLSRAFWVIVFIAMVSMFSYELYIMIAKFLTYPAMVNTNLPFEEQRFPVITVCNFNPLKYSVVKSDSKFSDINDLMETYKSAVAGTLASSDKWGLYDVKDKPFDRDTRAQEALILETAKLSQADLDAATYSFEELITECSFSSAPCNKDAFTKIFNPVYGACYSFNEDKALNYSCNRAGIKFGLKLLITVSQTKAEGGGGWDFLPTTHSAGARVAINAPGTLPSLEATGINAGVGYQTAISVNTAHTNRAKRPYGICVNREPTDTDIYANYTYTLETCFNGCRQRKTNEVCSCTTPRFPLPSGMSYCEPTKANLDCLASLKGDQTNKANPNMNAMTECDCNPPCSEDSYTTTSSLAWFPATSYYVGVGDTGKEGVAGSCSPDNTKMTDPDACKEWYQGNSLLLSIFFESLIYDLYNEVPSYGIGAVINDLGGQAGLWMGLSVISVVEMVGLFAILMAWCVSGGAIKIRPNSNELESDHRIKDIDQVKKELDQYDKDDKDMMDSDDDAGKEKKKN